MQESAEDKNIEERKNKCNDFTEKIEEDPGTTFSQCQKKRCEELD